METIEIIFGILKMLSVIYLVTLFSHMIYQLGIKDNPKLFDGRAWKWVSALALMLMVTFVGLCVVAIAIEIV